MDVLRVIYQGVLSTKHIDKQTLIAVTATFYIRSCSQTTLIRFWLFMTTYPPPLTFSMYGMNVDKKWTFLDHLPTSSCKRSLWITPKMVPKKYYNINKKIIQWKLCMYNIVCKTMFLFQVEIKKKCHWNLCQRVCFGPCTTYRAAHPTSW